MTTRFYLPTSRNICDASHTGTRRECSDRDAHALNTLSSVDSHAVRDGDFADVEIAVVGVVVIATIVAVALAFVVVSALQ